MANKDITSTNLKQPKSKKWLVVGIGLVALILIFAGLAYLGRDGDQPKTDKSDGAALVGSKQLPTSYPSDEMPTYKGAELIESSKKSYDDPGVTTYNLTLSSKDSVNKIADYYRGIVSQKGWAINSDATEDGVLSLSAVNDQKQLSFGLALAARSGVSTIQISLTTDD